MIVELFGPPGAGKTTLLRALCLELTKNGVPLRTVNGYRRIDSVTIGSDVDLGPEVRHGIDRLVRKLAATATILLSPMPDTVARLLSAVPPESRMWALRQRVDLALLCEARRTAEASGGVFIFEEGFVQSMCALVLLAGDPEIDRIEECFSFLPRPDLLIYIDAPDDVLRRRLVDRHARQTLSSRFLEIGLDRDLKQAHVARQVADCAFQAGWPLMRVDGAGPSGLDEICSRIRQAVAGPSALAAPSWTDGARRSPRRLRGAALAWAGRRGEA